MESPNLYVRLWLKIFLLELFRSRRSWGNRTLSPDLRDPSRPGFKIRGAVERVLSGAERTAPAPLRSIYFFILRSTAPLQVIFWIQSGSLLQNCQKGALTPCSRCWSNMWAFRALLLNFRSTAPLHWRSQGPLHRSAPLQKKFGGFWTLTSTISVTQRSEKLSRRCAQTPIRNIKRNKMSVLFFLLPKQFSTKKPHQYVFIFDIYFLKFAKQESRLIYQVWFERRFLW